MTLKVITWNINSIRMRLQHLIELIQEQDPDIIALQEIKCTTENFPYEELSHLPYNFYVHGQKSHNGVAILSKIPAEEIKTDYPENPLADQARFIEGGFMTYIGYIRVISVYIPNGSAVGSDKFIAKLKFYDAFYQYLEQIKSFAEKTLICSDYNVAPFDIDVYNPDNLQNSTCFTYEERAKLRSILNSDFVDNFRILHPNKQEFSWWDYRARAFEHNMGMRIDSIISSSNMAANLVECEIEQKSRQKLKPSDHAPVIACYDYI